MKHLLSISSLTPEVLAELVDRGSKIISGSWQGYKPLADKKVGIFFRGTSTRTRTAFTLGAMELGAHVITYGPNDLQLSTGETVQDTGRVLACYLDALVIRTNQADSEMEQLAEQNTMAVINAMSENEHPTQVIGDLISIQEAFDRLNGIHVLYVGDGNNTASALALAVAKTRGMKLTLVTPEGYGVKPHLLNRAIETARETGSEVSQHHDINALPRDVDVVYATRWETMGVIRSAENWRDLFLPYRVDATMMAHVSKTDGTTVFMHDLPAIRGSDCTDEVLDGPQSIAFRQARHKQTGAMVVLDHCLRGD